MTALTMSRLTRLSALFLLNSAVVMNAHAQPARTVSLKLGAPTATVTEDFSQVADVRELLNGRVLITDSKEHRLIVADLAKRTAGPLGRTGSGPGEYRWVEGMLPRFPDGVYVLDPALRRLLPVAGDGSFQTPINVPRGMMLRATEANGAFIGEMFMPRTATGMADSMRIVRWQPSTNTFDTLMTYDAGVSKSVGSGARAVLPSIDTWTVLPRGQLLLMEAARYRAHVLRAERGAKQVLVSDIPFEARAFTDRDRSAFLKERAEEPAVALGQPSSTPGARPSIEYAFPKTLPPFGGEGLGGRYLFPSPRGHVWVARTRAPSDSIARYDVLTDDSAKLLAEVLLPPRSRVVSMGRDAVYLVVTDNDGVEKVVQYAYPVIPKPR